MSGSASSNQPAAPPVTFEGLLLGGSAPPKDTTPAGSRSQPVEGGQLLGEQHRVAAGDRTYARAELRLWCDRRRRHADRAVRAVPVMRSDSHSESKARLFEGVDERVGTRATSFVSERVPGP